MLYVAAAAAVSNESLISAFIDVFELQDTILTIEVEPLQVALQQLRKNGIPLDNVCNMSEPLQARILMQNAKAITEFELMDKQDWRITMGKHHFKRQRSYSLVRFAVVECLLLVTVVALAFMIWVK